MIRFRLGEPVVYDPADWISSHEAILAVRQGQVPVTGEFVPDHAVDLVRRALANDLSLIQRELHSSAARRSMSSPIIGPFIAALAPRLRPHSQKLLDVVESPRWSLRVYAPGTVAWDAAGRRDLLRLLGENERALRWAGIAERQWKIASALDLAICFSLLEDILM